jgi:hypothetical protein
MESSILKSTKKILGLSDSYVVFDLDIITHINAAFSVANQLGVGPLDGYMIEDEEAEWADLLVSDKILNLLKTYVYLKVKMLFDPPTTSFLLEASKNQIQEYEWRLTVLASETTP